MTDEWVTAADAAYEAVRSIAHGLGGPLPPADVYDIGEDPGRGPDRGGGRGAGTGAVGDRRAVAPEADMRNTIDSGGTDLASLIAMGDRGRDGGSRGPQKTRRQSDPGLDARSAGSRIRSSPHCRPR